MGQQYTAPLIIFDGDCAFCSRMMDWALGHIDAEAIAFQQLGVSDLAEYGLNRQQVQESVWVISQRPPRASYPLYPPHSSRPPHRSSPDIPRLSGAAACAELLRSSEKLQWRLAGHVMGAPGVLAIAEWGYRIIAANRHRLPGGTGSCRL